MEFLSDWRNVAQPRAADHTCAELDGPSLRTVGLMQQLPMSVCLEILQLPVR
jgi:hypothetical protein